MGPTERIFKVESCVDVKEKIILWVGDYEEGPPREVRTAIKRAKGLSWSSEYSPGVGLTYLPLTLGYTEVITRFSESPPEAPLNASADDIFVLPLIVNEGGPFLLFWRYGPKSESERNFFRWIPPHFILDHLPAGNYELLIRAMGRDELREWIDVTIYPVDRPQARTIQIRSEFGRSALERGARTVPDGSIAVEVRGHRDVYFTGERLTPEQRYPRFMTAPRWQGVPRTSHAFSMGNGIAGIDSNFPEFAVVHLSTLIGEGLVTFEFRVMGAEPPMCHEAATDAMKLPIQSEGGQVFLLDGEFNVVTTIDLPRPGQYGMTLIAQHRDAARWFPARKDSVSPEHWLVEFWPVLDGKPFPVEEVMRSRMALDKFKYSHEERRLWRYEGYSGYEYEP